MSELQLLRLFINERLAAAAEDIFGAVERTIMELQSKSVCKEDVLLMLAEAEGAEEVAAVALEVGVSGAGVSTQSSTTEEGNSGGLDTQGPDLVEDKTQQLHKVTSHDLLHGEACLQTEQSTQTSSCGQSQTKIMLLAPKFEHCEEKAAGCGETNYCQAFTSKSATEGVESRESNSSNMVKSAREVKQKSTEKGTNAFCCKMCGEHFSSWSSLLTHFELHTSNHAVSLQGALQPSETKNVENNLCHLCSKTFKSKKHLKRHMVTHAEERRYCCTDCGRRFTRGECLEKHMRIHRMEKPYTCEVCKKMFRQKIHLVTHMRTHTGEKPYHCNICSAQFAYKVDLMKHKQIHTKT